MKVWEALILGLVQGFTEFLPVSSSGHLVLVERILGVANSSLAFELITHLGTLLAVIIVMRSKIFEIIKHPFGETTLKIVIATLPTVLIVVLFEGIFRTAFDGRYLVYCFIFTAILLFVTSFVKPVKIKSEISYLDAAIIGIAQGFAAMPGISRSGTTICTSVLLKNDRQKSADFSFLISIPIIIGSAAMELLSYKSMGQIDVLPLIIGFFAAFTAGLLSIKLLIKSLNNLQGFAIYLIFLSVFIILNDFLFHLF